MITEQAIKRVQTARKHPDKEVRLRLLQALDSRTLALALDELADRAKKAFVDPLTGLLNRHGFEHKIKLLRDPGSAVSVEFYSVMMIDCDDLKKVNDDVSHFAGDALLQGISRAITIGIIGGKTSIALKERCIIVRWGGDEFLVILINVLPADAKRFAERVQDHAGKIKKPGSDTTATVSVGIAHVRSGNLTDTALYGAISQADKAAYSAKHAGKNKIRHFRE